MSNEINCNDPIAIITQVLDDMQKEQGKIVCVYIKTNQG